MWPRLAAAVSPVVVVDELSNFGERCVELLVRRVVEARATVKQDDRRTLTHRHPVGDELRPIDIDEQPNVSDRDEHDPTLTAGWRLERKRSFLLGALSDRRLTCADIGR